MKIILLTIFLAFEVVYAIDFKQCAKVQDNPDFEVEKYTGIWYAIQRLPASFAAGIKCSQAEYSIINNSTVGVKNTGIFENQFGKNNKPKISFIEGTAIVKNPKAKNKLIVTFPSRSIFLPAGGGNYQVVDTDYNTYSLVYSCRKTFGLFRKEFAFILSRTRTLDPAIVQRLRNKLKVDLKVDISKLETSDQTNC